MDTRLYILAGLFVLVVVALIVLLGTLVRASRDRLPYPVEPEGVWPMLKPAPPEIVEVGLLSKADDKFARPATGATALLSQPLRTGSWKPHEEASPASAQTDDYWDSLIDEPSLLVRATRPPAEPSPSAAPAQPVTPDAVPGKGDELSTMIQELEEESKPVVEPMPSPVPAVTPPPPPAASPPLMPIPVPVIELPQEPEPIQASTVEPETPPVPAPVIEPSSEPAVEPQPSPVPAVAAPPPPPVPIPAPVPVIELPQEPEPIQVSTVEPETRPAPAPVIESPSEPVVEPELPPVPQPEPRPQPDVLEHVLVAPVEMWFGESRVGVKAGTRTYDLFQKYATVIREDYRRVTSGPP